MKLSRLYPALLTLACSAGILHADIVTLKDGKKLEGKITAENPQSIHMRYKLTAKIWDDKDIPRSEITEIIKQKPEEVEFIELKKLFPTADLMTAEKYETLIQDQLRPFVNRYPGTKETTEVEKMIALAQEEKGKVVAGGAKLEGKWLNPEDAKAENYNIRAFALRTSITQKIAAKDFSGALKDFGKMSDPNSGFIASIYYPKTVEEVLAVLTQYQAQLEQMSKDQPLLQKTRDDNLKKLIEPDLSRMKAAIKQEAEQWKSTSDQERSTNPMWYTPYKYDLGSIKTLLGNVTTEKARLKEINIANITKANEIIAQIMRDDARATKDPAALAKMGDGLAQLSAMASSLSESDQQFYGNVYQSYVQRHTYAQEQLAMRGAAQQQMQPPTAGVASGSSAIAGVSTPGATDDRVAAALAAAANGSASGAMQGQQPVAAMPAGGYPQQQPGAYPQQNGYPQQQPGAYPQQNGYPQQQPGAYPQQEGYPQQQPGAYPQQNGYPQQQPGAYPQQNGYPQQQPGAYPQQEGYPQQQPGAYPQQNGYPQQQPGAYPQQQQGPQATPAPAVEEEGGGSIKFILIGIGVVVLVALLTMLGGKRKKQ